VIKVLRLLEYTYPSVEAMEKDMQLWFVGANCARQVSANKVIKSATLPIEVLKDLPEYTPDSEPI